MTVAVTTIPLRTKRASEVRTLTFDFVDKLADGDTLTGSPTMTYPSGVTEVTSSRSSNRVLSRVSGGTEDTVYRIVAQCGTTNGDTLQLAVDLRVDSDQN